MKSNMGDLIIILVAALAGVICILLVGLPRKAQTPDTAPEQPAVQDTQE